MAELNVQKTSVTGLSPVFVAADAAGDTFTNYGNAVLHVMNEGAAPVQVTVASNPCDFGENHDVVISVPASEERIIGVFNQQRFNDENFKVNVSYDDVTSVNVAAIKY